MGIQSTILHALGVAAGFKKAQKAEELAQTHLDMQQKRLAQNEAKIKQGQETLELRKQREQRLLEEQPSRVAFQEARAQAMSAKATKQQQLNDVNKIRINALKRAKNKQGMRLSQKEIEREARKIIGDING